MRLLAATFLICIIAGVAGAEDDPWAMDKPLVSPSRSFTIVQQREDGWPTTIHFQRLHVPDIKFTDVYAWPALFYISPNDCWMLQVQKSGSGDSIAFLFRIEPEGRVWRLEPSLMELAWTLVERTRSLHPPDLYHTGIEFKGWNLRGHLLHFTFHGTFMHTDAGVEIPLTYDLKKHIITVDTKSQPAAPANTFRAAELWLLATKHPREKTPVFAAPGLRLPRARCPRRRAGRPPYPGTADAAKIVRGGLERVPVEQASRLFKPPLATEPAALQPEG